MNQKNNKKAFSILFLTIFLFSIFYIFIYSEEIKGFLDNKINFDNKKSITIKDRVIKVEIADNDTKRLQGLSGRSALSQDEGMLFVFEKPGLYGIWMKDMNFNIDILWFDENNKLIYFIEDAKPDSFPKTYIPDNNSKFILEINSGFIKKEGLEIGDKFDF